MPLCKLFRKRNLSVWCLKAFQIILKHKTETKNVNGGLYDPK